MASTRQLTTGVAITKSDVTVYNPPLRKLWVGGTGDVVIRTSGGSTLTLTGAATGSTIEGIAIDQIKNATTATLLVGFRG